MKKKRNTRLIMEIDPQIKFRSFPTGLNLSRLSAGPPLLYSSRSFTRVIRNGLTSRLSNKTNLITLLSKSRCKSVKT